MLASVIEQMAVRAPGKPTYFAGGMWHSQPPCWTCDLVPGEVAAIVSVALPHDPRFRQWAQDTFDSAITDHRQPDGSFGTRSGGASNEIPTIWTLGALGTTYLELRATLPVQTRRRWQRVIASAARALLPDLGYYVNGNINLALTSAMYAAWRATGDPLLQLAYRRSWNFTLRPRGTQARGFGLRITKMGTRADGADGAGYLAEKGAGAAGFDPHYTGVQAGEAARLFALSHDPQVLRLLNLLTNELLQRTNRRTLMIVNGSGTRRTFSEGAGRFESPCIPVAALAGGRVDLLPLVTPQLRFAATDFHNYVKSGIDQNSVIGDYASSALALRPPR